MAQANFKKKVKLQLIMTSLVQVVGTYKAFQNQNIFKISSCWCGRWWMDWPVLYDGSKKN